MPPRTLNVKYLPTCPTYSIKYIPKEINNFLNFSILKENKPNLTLILIIYTLVNLFNNTKIISLKYKIILIKYFPVIIRFQQNTFPTSVSDEIWFIRKMFPTKSISD